MLRPIRYTQEYLDEVERRYDENLVIMYDSYENGDKVTHKLACQVEKELTEIELKVRFALGHEKKDPCLMSRNFKIECHRCTGYIKWSHRKQKEVVCSPDDEMAVRCKMKEVQLKDIL